MWDLATKIIENVNTVLSIILTYINIRYFNNKYNRKSYKKKNLNINKLTYTM